MTSTAEAPSSEDDRQILRMVNGVRYATQSTPAPIGLSPRTVAGFRGKSRIYSYAPVDGARLQTPLVLFPYLGISRPYIFDLRPGESFAEFLVASGVSFYLCDWGIFGPEDREMGMDEVIGDMIPSLLRQALAHAGAEQATLFGYCMGVPMVTSALARDPGLPVRNLLAMVGPIDFGVGEFPAMTRDEGFDVDAIVETFDLMPAEFIRAGFKMINPTGDAKLQAALAENIWNEEWLRGFRAMNRWSEEWVPLPKRFYREWIRHFYQGNELIQGKFRVRGEAIDLSRITAPLLGVGAKADDIVPVASARALADAVSSTDKRFLELPGGHISVIAGRRARQEVWPTVLEWLREHDR